MALRQSPVAQAQSMRHRFGQENPTPSSLKVVDQKMEYVNCVKSREDRMDDAVNQKTKFVNRPVKIFAQKLQYETIFDSTTKENNDQLPDVSANMKDTCSDKNEHGYVNQPLSVQHSLDEVECGTILNAKKEDDGEQNPMVQTNHELGAYQANTGVTKRSLAQGVSLHILDMKCRNGVKILMAQG